MSIAEQSGRKARALDDGRPLPGHLDDRALERLGRQAEVGVAGEVAGHHFVGVDHGVAPIRSEREQRLLAAGDDQIAAEQQARAAGRDAHRLDVLRARRDAQMAHHGAALLGEAGHLEHGRALALEMRRHAEQLADGHDAGAADPANDDAVALVQRRQLRLG